MLVTIITIYFYKELTGNPEIGNISVYVLPNIWRLTKCCRMPGLQLSKFRITPPPPLPRPTISHGIFETNSSFRVEWRTAGRV